MEITEYGGKRKGAGRKAGKTFTEPSKPLSVRIPVSVYESLKKKHGSSLNRLIRKYLVNLDQAE